MSLDKSLIRQRFVKANQSYSTHAVVQQQISEQLCKLMRQYCPPRLQSVLEIGAGSGNLTRQLTAHFEISTLYLNDLYPEVQAHFKHDFLAHWLIGDIETLALPSHLNAIVSSSSVQWMDDLPALMARCHSAMQTNGWLCLSSFGPDNFNEIKQLTGQGLSYWSLSDWQRELKALNFEIVYLKEQHIVMPFDSPNLILKHLKATGVTATSSQKQHWNKQRLAKFYQDYKTFQLMNSTYPLTYHPIYCIARRTA